LNILVAKEEADRLFEDVLERKDRADGTRNALGVLQRFRCLFHLPTSLERNIQKAEYDLVINDYARAKALFGNTDVQVKLSKRIFDFVNLIH
jgi:exocyst complex component 2